MLDQDNCRVDPLYWILFRRRSRSVEDHFSDSSKITVCQNFFFFERVFVMGEGHLRNKKWILHLWVKVMFWNCTATTFWDSREGFNLLKIVLKCAKSVTTRAVARLQNKMRQVLSTKGVSCQGGMGACPPPPRIIWNLDSFWVVGVDYINIWLSKCG